MKGSELSTADKNDICNIIKDCIGYVVDETDTLHKLGYYMDDLTYIEIVVSLENHFKINIDIDKFSSLGEITKIYKYIHELI